MFQHLNFLDPELKELTLPETAGLEASGHVFNRNSIVAINAALATRRPLLVRGEPGTGKSQLARAAAVALGRVFLSKVIDSRTESRDLLFTFDAVARLADAQVQGALQHSPEEVRHQLRESKYIAPGPLWWAFDWIDATKQAKESGAAVPNGAGNKAGAVLLIDEIDKADSALPNGLLEALGYGRFSRPGGGFVTCKGVVPLTIITTNEERSLPDAFLRRCLVLELSWPKDAEELKAELLRWGRSHFPEVDETVLKDAAVILEEDRRLVQGRGLNPPGGAEYIDLVRAVVEQRPKDTAGQKALLQEVRRYVLNKHPHEGKA